MDIHNDMIAMLLNEEEEEEHGSYVDFRLTEEHILDLLISIINAGYKIVSTTTMMVVKYLHECLEDLRHIRVSILYYT